jgi:hypothetical protein
MAKKEFPGQFQDEDVLFVFKRHPIVMRKGLIIMMVTILIGALVGMFMSRDSATIPTFLKQFFTPIGIGFAVGAVGLFYYWIGWYYSICIVTNKRLLQIKQKGIFKSRSVNDINLGRILSVNYEISGMLETLLGFGTIIIQTLVGDFMIKQVSKPAYTQSRIVSAIKESGVELDEEASDVE